MKELTDRVKILARNWKQWRNAFQCVPGTV